jgi:serralysin
VLRRIVCPALAVLATAAMVATTTGPASANEPPPGAHAGPPYKFKTELISYGSQGATLKDSGWLTREQHGYRLRTGQQDSHLVVTLVDGRLRFADRGTKRWTNLPNGCHRQNVRTGIAAVCRVPAGITTRRPLLIELWPRLGNDYTDTSSLSAKFAVTMLGDKGLDVAHFGAGPDFFNGYSGRDLVWGGAGNDWVRSGLDNDFVDAGTGNDDVVSVDGDDTVRGGAGRDRLWAGDGNDRLWGGTGADHLICGNGRDRATIGAGDSFYGSCESVNHY